MVVSGGEDTAVHVDGVGDLGRVLNGGGEVGDEVSDVGEGVGRLREPFALVGADGGGVAAVPVVEDGDDARAGRRGGVLDDGEEVRLAVVGEGVSHADRGDV